MSQEFDVEAVFREEMDKAVVKEINHSGFSTDDWFWSGRYDADAAIEKWYEDGPVYVQNFIDWYEHNPDVSIWVDPEGTPAIELPFEVQFGPVEFRGYIDLVLQIGTALVVVDLKTSSKTPFNYRQLAVYAGALEIKYGIRPRYGTYFMCRGTGPRNGPKTYFQRPIELSQPQYSVEYLTREFMQAEQAIQAGLFPASPGEHCGRCGVAYACTEAGGYKAKQLDPSYPGGNRA